MNAKKKIIILIALATAIIACNDGGVIVIDDYVVEDTTCYEIKPIESLDAMLIKNLDSIFSDRNKLLELDYPHKFDDNICIINSEEELMLINPYDIKPNIDFSCYTLIGGRIWATSPELSYILLCEKRSNYLFEIKVICGSWQTIEDINFWKLYPKLKQEKEIDLKIFKINWWEE